MAAPINSPVYNTSLSSYTPATGIEASVTDIAYQLAPYPVANPPYLLGVDAVIFQGSGTATITFPNLPIRGTASPLKASGNQPQTITIAQGDLLIFEVTVQVPTGVVALHAQAIDTNHIVYPGPFLHPTTFQSFQAVITASGTISTIVWGKLYIQHGSITQ